MEGVEAIAILPWGWSWWYPRVLSLWVDLQMLLSGRRDLLWDPNGELHSNLYRTWLDA